MCDVNIATGEVTHFSVDVMLPGIIPFHFIRQYESGRSAAAGDLGYGWSHNLDVRVRILGDKAKLIYDNGQSVDLAIPEEGQTKQDDDTGLIVALTPHTLVVTEFDLNRFVFPRPTQHAQDLLVARREDPYGNSLQFSYDHLLRLTRVIDTAGRMLILARDGHGRITGIGIQPARDVTDVRVLARYGYDAAGDLVAWADATGVPYRFGYHDHLLVHVTNRIGGNLYYQYDADRACVRTWRDGGVLFRELGRDAERRTTVLLDSRGYRTVYRVNEHGLTEEEVDPLGRVKQNAYDPAGQLLVSNSESGGIQEVTRFDKAQRTLTVCTNSGETVFRLDEHGRPIAVTNAEGHTSLTEYDRAGNVTRTVSPLGAEWRFYYDERGYLIGAIDPRGYRVRKARSPENVITVSDDFGVMYRAYNGPLGEPVVLEDGLGRQTRFEADAAGRVTKVIYADGASATYAYDAEGNLVRATDETGLVTEYRYDGNSSLLEQVEPDGNVLRFDYDTEENLVSVTNFRGERAEFVYDAVGHEVRMTYFDGRVEEYTYDERDNVVALRDEAGRVVARYGYDDASRLVLIRWADGTETRITYGDQCQVLAIDGPDASIQYAWDAEMRIARETVNGATLDYEYDASGNRIAVTSSTGRRITYEWDLRGRLTGMTDSGRHAYRYEYNPVNLVTAAFLPNGVGQRFEYDALSRMRRRQVVVLAGGATIADRTFDYDAGDRLVRSEDLQRGTSTYRYDAAEHLVEAVTPSETERYEYDAAENLVLARSGLRAAVAAGDRVTSLGPAETYLYDVDGNLVEKFVGRDVTRYAYDAQGQLIRVTEPAGVITEYRYDPLGRRISKSRGGVETRFEWDGLALLRETSPGGDIDYLFLPQSFLPAGLTRGTQHYSYAFDQIGTPSELVSPAGDIVWSADYSAFGEDRRLLASAVGQPFRFQGQYFDDELGLCYNRHRYYDPALGRFLTPDPIGFEGGVNQYRYVPNPINWVDPFGLVACSVQFKCSWSKQQREEAQKKVLAINDQLGNGKKIPDSVPSACANRKNAKKIYEKCRKSHGHRKLKETSSKCSNEQADHIREVCLGGKESDCNNLQPLNQSVNASFGSQMKNCAKANAGKMLTKIKVKPGCKPGGKKCPDV